MTQNQILTMASCGVASMVVGAGIMGISVYKLMQLGDEASYRKLDNEDRDEMFLSILGVAGGLGATYVGASLVGSSINNAASNSYSHGLNDMYKAINKGFVHVKTPNDIPKFTCQECPKVEAEPVAPVQAPTTPEPKTIEATISSPITVTVF